MITEKLEDKIDHINISVSNLEEVVEFFVKILNFQLAKEEFLGGKWIDKVVTMDNVKAKFVKLVLPDTETSLEIIQYYHPKGSTNPNIHKANQIGFQHIAFEVNNIEQVYKKLLDNNIQVFSELQTYRRNKKLCYFHGPDNIILELAEYDE